MDLIAKDIRFWGSLLTPKLSSTRIADLLEDYFGLSFCLSCECSSYHASNVFIFNIKSNLKNYSSKEYNSTKCKHCLHPFTHHVNPKVFSKPKRLVQEVVLKQDLAVLKRIFLNESLETQIILKNVIEDYNELLSRKSIPSQLIDSSNDTPAEIPSIEFIFDKIVKHIELTRMDDSLGITHAVKVFLSYLDNHFTLPAKPHFSERDSALYEEFTKLYTVHCETPKIVRSLKPHKLSNFFGMRFLRLFHQKMINSFKFYYDKHRQTLDAIGPQYYYYSLLFDLCEKIFSKSSNFSLSLMSPKVEFENNSYIFENEKFFDLRFTNSLGPSSAKQFPDYEFYQIDTNIINQIWKKRKYDQINDEFFEAEVNDTCRLEYLDLEDCENDPKNLQSSRKYLLTFLMQLLYIDHLPNMAPAVRTKIVRPNKSILLIDNNNVFAGATYRIGDGFCELLFLVVNAEYQTKGYGSVLVDLLKDVCLRELVQTIYTFADNNALQFFEKQGFKPPPNEVSAPTDLFECNGATFMSLKIDKLWTLKNYKAVKLLRLNARDKMTIEAFHTSDTSKKQKTFNSELKKCQQSVRKFWRKFKEDSLYISAFESLSKKSCIKSQLKYLEFALEYKAFDSSIEDGNYSNDVEMFAFDMRRMLAIYRSAYQKKPNKKDIEDFKNFESDYEKCFDNFFPNLNISLKRTLT